MKKYLIPKLQKAKQEGQKLVALTAYDAFTALLLAKSDVDIVLVGDSLGNVIQGNDSTVPVTLDEMIYHGKIVARHIANALVIVDMPFGSYGTTLEQTVYSCVDVFKKTGAGAVKMEGASNVILEAIKRLVDIGVPVMGHLGYRPQSIHVYGGHKVDGKTDAQSEKLLAEAFQLEKAGCFSLVLECVIGDVAKEITENLHIPTIGIGSGVHTDGQILVIHDLLNMGFYRTPSFISPYADLAGASLEAVQKWSKDVKQCHYPSDKETFHIS